MSFEIYSDFFDFFSDSSISAFRFERTSISPNVVFSTLSFTFLAAFFASSFAAFFSVATAAFSAAVTYSFILL
jgi:hypothetical protein